MTEPRRVDVVYTEGRWLAAVAPDFEGEFESVSLIQLVEAVQQAMPARSLIFVVDRSTMEGSADARNQIVEAREEGNAQIILNVQEF